jgi:hypothetical protein
VLGVVGELLGVEEPLLVGSKDEVLPANDALQYPIREIHFRLSDTGVTLGPKKLNGSLLADRQNQT